MLKFGWEEWSSGWSCRSRSGNGASCSWGLWSGVRDLPRWSGHRFPTGLSWVWMCSLAPEKSAPFGNCGCIPSCKSSKPDNIIIKCITPLRERDPGWLQSAATPSTTPLLVGSSRCRRILPINSASQKRSSYRSPIIADSEREIQMHWGTFTWKLKIDIELWSLGKECIGQSTLNQRNSIYPHHRILSVHSNSHQHNGQIFMEICLGVRI